MRVIIAEKPSVAKNIADALGIKKRQDGYFEGDNYLVTWAFGHLLELYDAKDYDEKMAIWRMNNFPFVPNHFEYRIKQDYKKKKTDAGAKKQLSCIKGLINRKEVDAVISACDYDREGQIIGDIIFKYLKVKKPTYRILLNEWTEEEVKKGIEAIVPNSQLQPLQDAGISRQHADWLIGINLTSVATLKYKAEKGQVFNIGRVLLPTLKMIYDRDQEIEKFNPEPYFKLTGSFSYEDKTYEGTYTEDKKDKFEDQVYLIAQQGLCYGNKGVLVNKDITEKKEYPQPLFNLSALQGYVTSKYTGFTSDKVLKVAQSLYEKKYITYPRTASNVLDESLVDKAAKVLNNVKKGLPYENQIKFVVSPRVFNSKKVESHSAIIPTYMVPKNLGGEEALVYQAIKNRFLMQFMPIALAEETVMTTEVAGMTGAFISKGKVQKVMGWKQIEQDESKDTILPDLEQGVQVDVDKVDITSHATTPPKAYTEKTLLRAMETCGRQFKEDKDGDGEDTELMDAILSGFSIGTPATRAETIKKLCSTGYTMMQRKNIRCTPKGKQLIETLPVKELMDLEYTGKLEKTLSDMEKGLVAQTTFMNHIVQFVSQGVAQIKGQAVAPIVVGTNDVAPAQTKTRVTKQTKVAETQGTKETLGKCPICGSEVVEGNKGFGCMGYKQGCTYVIWKEDETFKKYSKKPTKTMVKALLKSGKATVKGFKTPKGTKFDAIVTYAYNPQQKQGEWGFTKTQ
ncbi:MAG: DNA topoisomerase [Cellulosilyticaceae bacterium]